MRVLLRGDDKPHTVTCGSCDSLIEYKKGEAKTGEEQHVHKLIDGYRRVNWWGLKVPTYKGELFKRTISYIDCPVCGERIILKATMWSNEDGILE